MILVQGKMDVAQAKCFLKEITFEIIWKGALQ
jgi:hypothetical protein